MERSALKGSARVLNLKKHAKLIDEMFANPTIPSTSKGAAKAAAGLNGAEAGVKNKDAGKKSSIGKRNPSRAAATAQKTKKDAESAAPPAKRARRGN